MTWIRTYTGRKFWILDPKPEDVDPIDMAHHLSNICRFTGAVNSFYSVAQHSVIVANLLPEHMQLHGLLHDTPEAYLNDVTTPLKRVLADYKRYEHNVFVAIYRALQLQCPTPQEVSAIAQADLVALATEIRDLGGGRVEEYGIGQRPMTNHIEALSPPEAEQLWMEHFEWLYGKGW